MLQMVKNKLKNQRGFTLIELLAVIVILGIIAAIAIPAIGNVVSKSKDSATLQDGIQIINAAKMYVANNNVTTTTKLARADLLNYLDHVKDPSPFSVDVTFTGDKVQYTLNGHPATKLTASKGDSATEQELVDALHQ